MNEEFMKERPVLPLLLSMALPMILSMLVNSLYNIVDSFFVAKISEDAMTALSLVFPIQNFVNAVAIGFGVGINAVIAFYLGAKEPDKANAAASKGTLLSVVHGVIMTVVCILIMPGFLRMFTSNETVVQMGIQYSMIVFAFSVIISIDLSFEKIYQAVGRMVVTMVGLGGGCLMNIVLDPLLIFGIGPFPKMGIAGAALATVLGYTLSMLIALVMILFTKQKVRLQFQGFRIEGKMLGDVFASGLPSFIMNALGSFMVTFVNIFLVAYSDTAVAFFGAYFKVQQLIVMTVNGLIQGCLPIMRFNYGAGNSERLHSAFRYGTVLVTGMMILGTLTVLLFPAQILGLFMASEAMRSFGISAMRIMAASYLFCGLSTMISTYFQTTEKVGSSMAIQLCRQMLFLVPALWCLDKLFQLNGIWLAFPVAETATLLVALVMMAWHRRKNIS